MIELDFHGKTCSLGWEDVDKKKCFLLPIGNGSYSQLFKKTEQLTGPHFYFTSIKSFGGRLITRE